MTVKVSVKKVKVSVKKVKVSVKMILLSKMIIMRTNQRSCSLNHDSLSNTPIIMSFRTYSHHTPGKI